MQPSSQEESLVGWTHKRSEATLRNADRDSLPTPETSVKAAHGHGEARLTANMLADLIEPGLYPAYYGNWYETVHRIAPDVCLFRAHGSKDAK